MQKHNTQYKNNAMLARSEKVTVCHRVRRKSRRDRILLHKRIRQKRQDDTNLFKLPHLQS